MSDALSIIFGVLVTVCGVIQIIRPDVALSLRKRLGGRSDPFDFIYKYRHAMWLVRAYGVVVLLAGLLVLLIS